MVKHLFDTEFNLQDGTLISGPITTEDDSNFLFHNTHSSVDFHFRIRLHNERWQFVDGSDGLSLLDDIIETVGKQIEDHYLGNPSELD
ncbi:hypothetical protein [Mucilaginibacter agri]|uniref:Uncharacterized protein n=1 Tax=Mucilaginibacter agri TaxID=2695265 RepID=A0A965ZM55_9SPHI|nr:hypothetical protein [Mucilaginibacter agri]NCD72152.1 hypothetical protein [Mucilaginibacter agri]